MLKTLLTLAWPIVISRATQVVVGLSDVLLVAHLGESAVAAVGTGALNTYALFIFPMGIVFLVSSFASQYFGRRDLGGARRYAWYGLVIAALTQVLCLVSIPAVPWVLRQFSYAPDVHELMSQYLCIRLVSGGAAIGVEALANYFGALGNTHIGMRVSVLTMVLNVLGNWLLIDGRFGLPGMGVAGSAWASVLSTWLGAAVLVLVFVSQRTNERIRLVRAEFLRLLRFGIPSGLNWFTEFFAFNVFINVVVAGLGTTALATMMTVFQLSSAAFMPAFGLASAGAILVGQAIGARRLEDVPPTVRATWRVALVWQAVVGAVYLSAPHLMLRPFAADLPTDSTFVVVGTRVLMVSGAWLASDATATVFAEALRAAGDTRFIMWARLTIAWGLFAPGAYLHVRYLHGNEVTAAWWVVAYLTMLAAVLVWRFYRGRWRDIALLEPSGVSENAPAPT